MKNLTAEARRISERASKAVKSIPSAFLVVPGARDAIALIDDMGRLLTAMCQKLESQDDESRRTEESNPGIRL